MIVLSVLVRYGLIIGGSFMLAICSMGFWMHLKDKRIIAENKIVDVEIIECYKQYRSYFLKLKFKDKVQNKRVRAYNCRELKGKTEISMLTNIEEDRFLFSDELERKNQLTSLSFISLIAFVIMYKGIKEVKK